MATSELHQKRTITRRPPKRTEALLYKQNESRRRVHHPLFHIPATCLNLILYDYGSTVFLFDHHGGSSNTVDKSESPFSVSVSPSFRIQERSEIGFSCDST